MKDDKYNQEHYFKYYPEFGIYDMLDSPIVGMIKSLPWTASVPAVNQPLDSLSLDYYRTEQLWWVLAIYNNITDALNVIESVDVIYIPDRLELELLLSDYKKQ